MKRIVSILIALLLVLAMVPVMASGEETIKRQENGLPDFEGRVFTIWYRNRQAQNAEDLGTFHNVQKLEELLNCDIQFIHPPEAQVAEHFAITMAEDKLPDMIFCKGIDNYYPGGLTAAYDDGILFDYTDLINETNTPNFVKVMMEDPWVGPLMKDDYGRIVRLGAKMQGAADCDYWYEGIYGRSDLLAATGLEKPTTIEEFYNVLTAMKANGVEYPYSCGATGLKYFAFAYDIVYDDFYLGTDGSVKYGPYDAENYKAFLTEMNKWYSAGLIHPDFMSEEGVNQIALMMEGKAGIVGGHIWNWPFEYNVTNTNEEAKLAAYPYPKLTEDQVIELRYNGRSMDDYKYITADAEDPLACVVLLDTLYIPEISYMMGDGIEGKAWEYNDVGVPQGFTEVEDVLDKGISEWHMYEDASAANVDNKWSKEAGDAIRLWGEAGTSRRIPGNERFLFYTTEEAEIRANCKADIQTYASEMFLKFVVGTESLDNFDAYIAQLEAMGVKDLIAVQQAAYDRLLARY